MMKGLFYTFFFVMLVAIAAILFNMSVGQILLVIFIMLCMGAGK